MNEVKRRNEVGLHKVSLHDETMHNVDALKLLYQ